MQAPHILILDDDDHYALLFSTYLKLSGVKGGIVEHAVSTEEAVARLRSFKPDVIFLDNRVPPHSDFRSGLRAIRGAGYEGPVVVQSACTVDEVLDDAAKLGVAEVIDKLEMSDIRLMEILQKHTTLDRS